MAWNRPGNNSNSNDRDPWGGHHGGNGGGGNRKEPPDLDEVFRKLQSSLNGLFGGKGRSGNGSGSGSGGKSGGLGLFGIGLAVLTVFWLYNATYVVDEQEQAVILRFGKYYETANPGLNFYSPPIDKRFQKSVTHERAYSKQGQTLTEDENTIEVPLTVQYKISNLQDFVLNVDQPEVSLQQAAESVLRHAADSTTMDQILTEDHEQITTEVRERLQRFLDTYRTGIAVTQVNIQSAQAPHGVQEAFDDVIRAREDEQRKKNQAEAYANGVMPEARGQVQRIIEEANGYHDEVISRARDKADRLSKLLVEYRKAPEMTRERLCLDTMQEVFSQTSKVLVTSQQGQNSLLYLSLDKMIDDRNAALTTSAGASAGGGNASVFDLGSRIVNDLCQQSARTRKNRRRATSL